eukprot:CAMPEP_0204822538 /NCGR_PEP_ID=MMETSP1346-20131115/732_1 /ASSEMBLY_ACC=CAM_ASM_000771 /TAXON_ID=215587 /ORGANISM="Aplanochytrium stocchinoi, Strain GSBS06" /LENGTH=157 /DNA_ID=CAMNT_0051948801 /DNA_START=183 /DNA_END=656 /DNA_ORIENTATION=+
MTRGIDWTSLSGKVTTTAARGEVARLRAIYDDLHAANQQANLPVDPIDWKAYESKISSPGVTDAFMKAYETLELPSFVNTQATEADKVLNKLVGEAKSAMDASAARATVLEAQLAQMNASRTTKNTTIDDVRAQYPNIKAEVEQEIKDEEWGKSLVN